MKRIFQLTMGTALILCFLCSCKSTEKVDLPAEKEEASAEIVDLPADSFFWLEPEAKEESEEVFPSEIP